MDGCRSKLINIMAGVPQDSVFGPLLFLVYTSELILELVSISVHLGFGVWCTVLQCGAGLQIDTILITGPWSPFFNWEFV